MRRSRVFIFKDLHKDIDFENDVIVDHNEYLIIALDDHVKSKLSKIRYFLGLDSPNLNYLLYFLKLGDDTFHLENYEVMYHDSVLLINTEAFLKRKAIDYDFKTYLNVLRYNLLGKYYFNNIESVLNFPIFNKTFGRDVQT